LEELRDHASCELNHSDLIGNTDAFVDALKNSSTLKSLICYSDTYDKDFAKQHFLLQLLLHWRSTPPWHFCIFLILGWNSIQQEGAIAIADALKVNSSLTSLHLDENSIQQEGANAIADALQINTTLE
jgi:Leucine Rich repeat